MQTVHQRPLLTCQLSPPLKFKETTRADPYMEITICSSKFECNNASLHLSKEHTVELDNKDWPSPCGKPNLAIPMGNRLKQTKTN